MIRPAAALLAAFLLSPAVCVAQETGEQVILTVVTEDGTHHELRRAALEAMPQAGFSTSTIWTEGPQDFAGVMLDVLLETLGAKGTHITLGAANGYRVDRSAAALVDGALVSYLRNGAPMTLRDKGPVWLVYNYDSDPAYRTEVIYANSIWQLDRIEITD